MPWLRGLAAALCAWSAAGALRARGVGPRGDPLSPEAVASEPRAANASAGRASGPRAADAVRAPPRPADASAAPKARAELSAMVVEQRCNQALLLTIANLREELPDVPIQVFYGSGNKEFLRSMLLGSMHLDRVTLTPLPSAYYHNFNRNAYQELFESPEFWDLVEGEKVLAFQADTWLCQHAADKLQSFLRYDYVGAPWGHNVSGCPGVGNGGLSVRTRKVMKGAAKESKERRTRAPLPEDVFFCHELELIDAQGVARERVAEDFSVEEVMDKRHDPFGVHAPWKHQNDVQMSLLEDACPGLDLLKEAQAGKYSCEDAKLLANNQLKRYREILEWRARGYARPPR